MSEFPYQIGLLGDYAPHQQAIERTIGNRFAELGLQQDDYTLLVGPDVSTRERKAPFAAIFFGYPGATNAAHPELDDVLQDSTVVLPLVQPELGFSDQIPSKLHGINGVSLDLSDHDFSRDVATILENFRLLRKERRLFISYKRSDSSSIATQLYDALDGRGFDVFLDTRGIPPGSEFQSVLWHRLADSDVVVLLDTPHFFESRWTEEELTRANATNIQILHVLWPGRSAPALSALSEPLKLDATMFEGVETGDEARLRASTINQITVQVEALRARALAARHRDLVDAFCDEARRRGLRVDVQPNRHITLKGKEGPIAVVPMVGVPSALRLNDVHNELGSSPVAGDRIWALYDSRGLLKEILAHLEWLNISLPLHAVSVFDVAARLEHESQA